MSDLMSIGRSGLGASKQALETTSHNISNANTEGYSRQKVDQISSHPIRKSGVVVGTGTQIRGVDRVEDRLIEKKIIGNQSNYSFFSERHNQLSQVQEIFNEIDTEGLNLLMNKFFNSFRGLANEPENEALKSIVRDNASLVVNDFNRIGNSLITHSNSIDQTIKLKVDQINHHSKKIADLNKRIAQLEASGDMTGDLRDQRDSEIRELSKIVHVNTYIDNRRNFVVNADGIGSLVSAGNTLELITKGVPRKDSIDDKAGSVEIYYKSKPNTPITTRFKGGVLASLVKVRNEDIYALKKSMDDLAFNFSNEVNAIHRKGFRSTNNIPENLAGDQINFFTELSNKKDSVLNLSISEEVLENLDNLVTSSAPNSSGNNEIALEIAGLQYKKILDNNQSSLEESFLKTVGNIGLKTSKAELEAEQTEGILAQNKSIKERITGVSLDEEAANLVKYQNTYQASAKVIQAAEEMFNTLINIGR